MGIISEYRIEQKFKHNILSVIFDSDSFFYAISDINNNLNIAVKYKLERDPLIAIPEIIEKETLAQHYYSSVNVFSKMDKFTFVPSNEYSYGDEAAFIRNSFQQDGCAVKADLSSKEHLHIIHGYPTLYTEAFSTLGSDQNFRHLSLAYLEADLQDGIYVSLYEKSMSILVRRDSKLLYYNQESAATSEDQLYFIMLAYNQLNLSPKETLLYLTGDIAASKKLKPLLSDYIAHIEEEIVMFTNIKGNDLHDLYLASICE